jgi:hypothetical protein
MTFGIDVATGLLPPMVPTAELMADERRLNAAAVPSVKDRCP